MRRIAFFCLVAWLIVPIRASATDLFFGGGSCSDLITCDIAMMTQMWGVNVPIDPAPPTVLNVLTPSVASGGYTNCVNGVSTSGCMTGQGGFSPSNCTISTSNFNVICPTGQSFYPDLTAGPNRVGWNYDIVQQNGLNNGSSSSYTGCEVRGTIASITSAGTFVANAPSGSPSSSGTCGADMGANDTTATVTIWDGKDGPGFANAMTAAGTLANAYNTGAVLYVPNGVYVWNQHVTLGHDFTIQCQDHNNTLFVMPDVGITNEIQIWGSTGTNNVTIKNCRFSGSNTTGHWTISREAGDWISFFAGGNSTLDGNIFEYTWGNEGLNFTIGAAGAGCGTGGICSYGFVCNTGNLCQPTPMNVTVKNNIIRYCQGNGLEIGEGQGVAVENNKFLDCDLKIEEGGSSTTNTIQFMWGNAERNNDLRCDAPTTGWGGHGGDGYFATRGDLGENGCSLTSNNDGSGNGDMSNSVQSDNHLHGDSSSIPAYCWSAVSGSGVKPKIRGNLCTSGENCHNGGSGAGKPAC